MASVPNRVYPMSEYTEINTIKLNTTDIVASGVLSGSKHLWSSVRTLSYTGSAPKGEIFIVTGAGGIDCTLYVKIGSGSTTAIWAGAALTYTSPG